MRAANQYVAQLSEPTLAAVFDNVGGLSVFQVGVQDAPTLAEQVGSLAEPADLMMLPKFLAYARLVTEGQTSRPFPVRTVAPPKTPDDPHRAEATRRVLRKRNVWPATSLARRLP